jgi:hypothetical protein
MTDLESPKRRHVFLSYAHADKAVADQVVNALRGAGHRVSFDSWELEPADSIEARILQAVSTSDYLLVLLSPKSVESKWVQYELGVAVGWELNLIPAMIEDCEIPAFLAGKQYIDLRKDFNAGLQRLVSQLAAIPDIEFSRLDPRTFESLVADLLSDLGFSVQRTRPTHDSGFDFIASYRSRDPFGAEKTETWLVESRLYREQRVSVSALRQMVGFLVTSRTAGKGLVVTNGRMTSVAREFLAEITLKSGQELRVIDGTELMALVIQRPSLVQQYFAHKEK